MTVTAAPPADAGVPPAGIRVRTVAIADPGPLLGLLPEHGALAWVGAGEGIVGWGEVARLQPTGPDRFMATQAWWRELVGQAEVDDAVGLPGSGLVAFGSFSFADGGASALVVPRVVVGARGGRWWRTTVDPADEPSGDVRLGQHAQRDPVGVAFTDGAVDGPGWARVVAGVVRRIEAGEVSKVVLAREVRAQVGQALDVRAPLRRLAAGYPGTWVFAVEGLLGATPEMLVRLRDGVVTSRVLAGTLRVSGDRNRDLRQGNAMARSIKDVEEHGYGVRSVAEALAPHCSAIEVPPAPFVLELPNVLHLATDVTGVVADGSTSLELVAALHPSAAVCGTPTEVARAMIAEVEGLDRGRYAGPVGWFDARGDGEWGIALRCGQVDPDDPSLVHLFAGCGIVAGSVPERELAESSAKLLPMRGSLGG